MPFLIPASTRSLVPPPIAVEMQKHASDALRPHLVSNVSAAFIGCAVQEVQPLSCAYRRTRSICTKYVVPHCGDARHNSHSTSNRSSLPIAQRLNGRPYQLCRTSTQYRVLTVVLSYIPRPAPSRSAVLMVRHGPISLAVFPWISSDHLSQDARVLFRT